MHYKDIEICLPAQVAYRYQACIDSPLDRMLVHPSIPVFFLGCHNSLQIPIYASLDWVVQRVDNAIHQINHCPVEHTFCQSLFTWLVWIAIYLVDRVIHPLNIWGLWELSVQAKNTTKWPWLGLKLGSLETECSALTITLLHGEQGWRSGESAHLPPMCPDSIPRPRVMWVEFIFGSHPCSEGFSAVFLPP